MQPQSFCKAKTTPKVVQSHALEDFECIHDTDIEAVIFNRTVPSNVSSFLEGIIFNKDKGERFFVPLNEVPDRAAHTLGELGITNCAERTWLIEDIQKLSVQLEKILSTPNIQVRIGVVDSDSCRRFHRDTVKARLICTYRGPGTVYGVTKPGNEPNLFEYVRTGDPILLKGKLWSEPVDEALLHRSPRIEGTGVLRLVVVMDEIASPY